MALSERIEEVVIKLGGTVALMATRGRGRTTCLPDCAPPDCTDDCSGSADCSHERFCTHMRALVFGHPKEAAQGINPFLGLSDAALYDGLGRGVAAIVDEFERNGSSAGVQSSRNCPARTTTMQGTG